MQIRSAKELDVYKLAYTLSMQLFDLSKTWPKNEQYALADQCRRSSRAVCASLREAWAKRRYEAHFVNKLTTCDGENSETDTWVDYALDCGYISPDVHRELVGKIAHIGAMLGKMMHNPKPFLTISQSPASDLRPPDL